MLAHAEMHSDRGSHVLEMAEMEGALVPELPLRGGSSTVIRNTILNFM